MKKWTFLVTFSLLWAATSFGQAGSWTLGIQPGDAVLLGYYKNKADNSFALQATADYQLTESLFAGIQLGYSFNHA